MPCENDLVLLSTFLARHAILEWHLLMAAVIVDFLTGWLLARQT